MSKAMTFCGRPEAITPRDKAIAVEPMKHPRSTMAPPRGSGPAAHSAKKAASPGEIIEGTASGTTLDSEWPAEILAISPTWATSFGEGRRSDAIPFFKTESAATMRFGKILFKINLTCDIEDSAPFASGKSRGNR